MDSTVAAETKPPTSHAASIRWRAGVTTLVEIPLGAGIALWDGKTVGQALALGLLGSLMGLACWVTYHRVSRQNDGLMLVGGFVAPIVMGPARLSGTFWLVLLTFAAGLGFLFGTSNRKRASNRPA